MQEKEQGSIDFSGTLPPDVILTDAEALELLNLETIYSNHLEESKNNSSPFTEKSIRSHVKLHETTNVGIHYFCLRNSVGLFALSGNNHISLDVARLIFHKVENEDFMSWQVAYYSLLSGPLVRKDLEVFKLIFQKIYSVSSAEATQLLFSFRNLAFTMPVDILLLLLTGVQEVNDKTLTDFYANVIEFREQEISDWIAGKFPDLAELPLKWVLHSRILKGF